MADEKTRSNLLHSRTKRKQLISSASSLTSLFNIHSGSTSTTEKPSGQKMAKKPSQKQKDGNQKERWLLTRKTWKYMADAGRRLIPEGMQHRNISGSQDLKKIEEYFQHVCRSEPRFLPWRRKQSYPGAMGGSLRRGSKRKTIAARMFSRNTIGSTSAVDNKSGASSTISSPPTKAHSADESEDDVGYSAYGGDEDQKMFLMIRMLEKYLKISNENETGNDMEREYEELDEDGNQKQPISPKDNPWYPKNSNTNATTSPTYSALSDEELVFSCGSSVAEDSDNYVYGAANVSPVYNPNYTEGEHMFTFPKQTKSSPDQMQRSQQTQQSQPMRQSRQAQQSQQPQQSQQRQKSQQSQQSQHSPSSPPRHRYPTTDLSDKINYSGQNSSTMHTSLLLESLRNYSRTSRSPLLSMSNLTPDVFQNKQLLRRIRDELKQQQLDKIFQRHKPVDSSRTTSSSMFSLPNSSGSITNLANKSSLPERRYKDTPHFQLPFLRNFHNRSKEYTTIKEDTTGASLKNTYAQSKIDSDKLKEDDILLGHMYLSNATAGKDRDTTTSSSTRIPLISVKCESEDRQIVLANSGTQTDPIPVNNIFQLYDEYKKLIEKESANSNASSSTAPKEEPIPLQKATGKSSGNDSANKHSRRKSSIDNEDVSQSVSDTIKRYLRMARKKNPKDNDANRFKRINYDTNLRNIKPKEEIPKPDELNFDGNMKGSQTNGDWITFVMAEVSLYMASRSSSPTDVVNKQLIKSTANSYSASSPSLHSSPSSPPSGGLTQTISKSPSHTQIGNKKALAAPNTGIEMQKSKSSSNVGQVFSKRIWKSRSKSQTRPDSPTKSQWSPQGNCIWISSANGKQVHLKPAKLQDLSSVEKQTLHRVALDRITQLNIGVSVKIPTDSDIADTTKAKPQKRRAPLLLKRKALTTGFFDSSKIKSDGNKATSTGGLVFGQPLEKCLSNDISKLAAKQSGNDRSSRSSRSSISSLLDGQFGISGSSVGKEALGSCDSLFTATAHLGHSDEGCGSSLEDDDGSGSSSVPKGIERMPQQQVPPVVMACIEHLTMYGLNVVGIFRVSTSKRRIRELREDLDRGTLTTFDSEVSPHDVASLLKEYFRDLPEPLMCRCLYPAFVSTQKIRNRRLQLEALSHIIQLLPTAHRDTLYVFLKFLAHVARCSDDVMNLSNSTCISVGNKMDSNNLATVIAPNILHCNVNPSTVASDEEAEERLDVINVVRTMIDHYEELFTVPADVMNDVYTTMMDAHPQQLDYICEREFALANKSKKIDDIDCDHASKSLYEQPFQKLSFSSIPHQIENSEYNASRQKSYPLDPSEQSRRIYVREEFTHENSANGQSDGNKRRERSSKMKYQQPEQEILSRRRRRDKLHSFGNLADDPIAMSQNFSTPTSPPLTPTRKTDARGHNPSMEPSSVVFYSDASSRRQSSPYVSHQMNIVEVGNSSDVVTASLKLPVQMATGTTLNLAADIPDIPFIEDGDSYSSLNTQIPTSMQPFKIYTTNILGQQNQPSRNSLQQQQQQQQQQSIFHGYSNPISSNTESKGNNIEKSLSLSTLGGNVSSGASRSNDASSKLSTSISNIGGDLLRSKTADFERLLFLQHQRSSKNSNTLEGNSNVRADSKKLSTQESTVAAYNKNDTSGAADNQDITSSATTKNSAASAKRSGPIYKRRDVISSAQSAKK